MWCLKFTFMTTEPVLPVLDSVKSVYLTRYAVTRSRYNSCFQDSTIELRCLKLNDHISADFSVYLIQNQLRLITRRRKISDITRTVTAEISLT